MDEEQALTAKFGTIVPGPVFRLLLCTAKEDVPRPAGDDGQYRIPSWHAHVGQFRHHTVRLHGDCKRMSGGTVPRPDDVGTTGGSLVLAGSPFGSLQQRRLPRTAATLTSPLRGRESADTRLLGKAVVTLCHRLRRSAHAVVICAVAPYRAIITVEMCIL